MTSIPSVVLESTHTQQNWTHYWHNSAVYVSADGGRTWQLFMYFPKADTQNDSLGR